MQTFLNSFILKQMSVFFPKPKEHDELFSNAEHRRSEGGRIGKKLID